MLESKEILFSAFKSFTFFPIHHILAYYDDATSSIHCIKASLEMAKEFNSSVTMLTISYSEVMASSFLNVNEEQINAEKIVMKKMTDTFNAFNSIAKHYNVLLKHEHILSTSIAESILSYANSNSVDLILMGIKANSFSHPLHSGLSDIKIKIFQGTKCPVLYLK